MKARDSEGKAKKGTKPKANKKGKEWLQSYNEK